MITTIAGTRILFLDLEDVQSRHNVVQTVCEAVKHPSNPLLPLGRTTEWDDRMASPWASRTIIYDEEESGKFDGYIELEIENDTNVLTIRSLERYKNEIPVRIYCNDNELNVLFLEHQSFFLIF